LYSVLVWIGTVMRYTRNTIRNISAAGGRDEIFFLDLNAPPFLNRRFRLNWLSSQVWILISEQRMRHYIRLGTEDGNVNLILRRINHLRFPI
jgi:hypothetical protein